MLLLRRRSRSMQITAANLLLNRVCSSSSSAAHSRIKLCGVVRQRRWISNRKRGSSIEIGLADPAAGGQSLIAAYNSLVESDEIKFNEEQYSAITKSQSLINSLLAPKTFDSDTMKPRFPALDYALDALESTTAKEDTDYMESEVFNILDFDEETKFLASKAARSPAWERALFRSVTRPRRSRIIKRVLNECPTSIWLWGSPLSGRSLPINMTYDALPSSVRKVRYRFPEFMQHIREAAIDLLAPGGLLEEEQEVDPIRHIVETLTSNIDVLFLDDFELTNVSDAMIMRRLFLGLFGGGVPIYATAYRPPSRLYLYSSQAKRLKPFLQLLDRQCAVVHMHSLSLELLTAKRNSSSKE